MTYVEPVDDNDIPVSSGYVPDTGFIATQSSSNISTDGAGKQSAPVNINLKQVGDVLLALGQAVKAASIPVVLPSDQVVSTLDTNSASSNTHLSNIDTATSDLVADLDALITNTTGLATQTTLAAAKADLDSIKADLDAINTATGTATDANTVATLMGRLTKIRDLLSSALTVSVNNFPSFPSIQRVDAIAGDFPAGSIVDLATLAGIVSGAKAVIKAATNDIVDLATLLARHNDTFGNNTAISAATTFGAIPLVAALAANSSANLTNNGYQDTFLVQINVASAFVGTIGFYGLLPDGTTLQQINAHQRGTATNGNSTAINTGSALEQTWEGSIAAFKAVYVVCSAFTSGAASVQIGLTAANYAHAIINTVAQNLTQINGSALSLGQTTKANSIPVTLPSDASIPINTGTPTETAVSVGVSNTSVLASNANRKFLSLVNDSPNTIYVTFSGTNAALNIGTRLNANGGAILFDRYVPTAAVKAIATAASSNLLVTEG